VIRVPFNRPFATREEIDYIRAAIAAPKCSGDGSFTAQYQGLLETVAWDSEDAANDILHSRAGDGCAPPIALKKAYRFS